MALWELRSVLIKVFKRLSDMLIVPKKQGNICAGKGLAERLFTLAEREGMSVEELLSRVLEPVAKAMRLTCPDLMFLEEL